MSEHVEGGVKYAGALLEVVAVPVNKLLCSLTTSKISVNTLSLTVGVE